MLTVALIQQPPIFLHRAASVRKAIGLIADAAAAGADLVVFPEAWLPGYPIWLDDAPGAALWAHPAAEALFAHLVEHSVVIDGEDVAALSYAAIDAGCDVVMGMHERDGGTLYNTTLMLGRDGCKVARRKLMPTHGERLIWGAGDGSTLDVWQRPYGRVGSLICWEHWMPLARAAMHARHETLHVAQWPAVTPLHQLASRTYAFEGQTIVLASGCVLTRDDVLDGFDSAGGSRLARGLLETISATNLKAGGSAVIGSDAEYLLAPSDAAETLYAQLDLEALTSPRPYLDVSGHYARPDIFRLTVDTAPKPSIVFDSRGTDDKVDQGPQTDGSAKER